SQCRADSGTSVAMALRFDIAFHLAECTPADNTLTSDMGLPWTLNIALLSVRGIDPLLNRPSFLIGMGTSWPQFPKGDICFIVIGEGDLVLVVDIGIVVGKRCQIRSNRR